MQDIVLYELQLKKAVFRLKTPVEHEKYRNMYKELMVLFCIVVVTTGKSMTADFKSCKIQCSNENDQHDISQPVWNPVNDFHVTRHRVKRGPRGLHGAKGEPGVECNKERVIQLEEQLISLKGELRAVKNKLESLDASSSLEERGNASVIEPLTYELRLTPRRGTFDEVRLMCVQLGGQLVQETLAYDVEGTNYLDEIWRLSQGQDVWIGITDRNQERIWRYLNNKPFCDSTSLVVSWNRGEPNNDSGPYNAAAVFHRSGILALDDRYCTCIHYGMCEIQN